MTFSNQQHATVIPSFLRPSARNRFSALFNNSVVLSGERHVNLLTGMCGAMIVPPGLYFFLL